MANTNKGKDETAAEGADPNFGRPYSSSATGRVGAPGTTGEGGTEPLAPSNAPQPPNPPPANPAGSVEMRVTTKGDGKIHTGAFEPGTHVPKFYKKGDVFHAPSQEAADQLIDRGLADTP